jgi:hypothetical protein
MTKGSLKHSHVHSSFLGSTKLLIFTINGVLCYFPLLVVLQGNARVVVTNVNKAKVEGKAKMETFLAKVFEKFYVAIWSWFMYET